MKKLFIELLQVSLGNREQLSRTPSNAEWICLFQVAQKQAVVGVLIAGIEKLPKEQQPLQNLLFQWIGLTVQIEQDNNLLNQRCIKLQEMFSDAGFRTCILKGQGNALMYPNPLKRQSGDIDIWVDGRIKDIVSFLITRCDETLLTNAYHHTEFPVWDDVEVEVHWRPSWKSSPIHNCRLQRWVKENKEKQFSNVDIATGLHIPTWEFNVVYLLQHMYLHIFQEGLGMRQVVDYYYLLKLDKRMEVQDLEKTLRRLDLYHFAGAVMYVLREALGMEEKFFIVPVDERRGAFLLEEILQSGNFGKSDERNAKLHKTTGLNRSLARAKRSMRYLEQYPLEVISAPFQIYHVIWRKLKMWRLEC